MLALTMDKMDLATFQETILTNNSLNQTYRFEFDNELGCLASGNNRINISCRADQFWTICRWRKDQSDNTFPAEYGKGESLEAAIADYDRQIDQKLQQFKEIVLANNNFFNQRYNFHYNASLGSYHADGSNGINVTLHSDGNWSLTRWRPISDTVFPAEYGKGETYQEAYDKFLVDYSYQE